MEKGMTVWSAVLDAFWCVGLLLPLSDPPPEWVGLEPEPEPAIRPDLCVPPVHSVQNTVSQVSQNNNSCNKRKKG